LKQSAGIAFSNRQTCSKPSGGVGVSDTQNVWLPVGCLAMSIPFVVVQIPEAGCNEILTIRISVGRRFFFGALMAIAERATHNAGLKCVPVFHGQPFVTGTADAELP